MTGKPILECSSNKQAIPAIVLDISACLTISYQLAASHPKFDPDCVSHGGRALPRNGSRIPFAATGSSYETFALNEKLPPGQKTGGSISQI
jgi:hypothetical protein